jgi:hypothetical protein
MNVNTKISVHGRKALDIRNKESNLGQFRWTAATGEETNIKERSYNYIIFQHSPLALQCTLSITAQSALWPQNKKFWVERQATPRMHRYIQLLVRGEPMAS